MQDRWPDSAEVWRGKRVIVTGGSGFLGSSVVKRLRAFDTDVLVPRSREYDLRYLEAIRAMFADYTRHAGSVDMVIHLAARVGGIGANQQHPAEFFYDNLMMSVQLLHETYRQGIAKFVGVGTVCSYPKHTPVPFSESALWDGYPEETNAPYGLAKKMLIVASEAYKKQYGFNSISVLPTNLYGPGDNFDPNTSHVIPALIRKFAEAAREPAATRVVTVWGTGSATREFLYVDDAARGIVLAAERYNSPEPVNIGSGQEISIRKLVSLIAELIGYAGEIRWDTSKPDGQPRRLVDSTRARERFGFVAETPFDVGLRQTVNWYRSVALG